MNSVPNEDRELSNTDSGYLLLPGEGQTIRMGAISVVVKAASTDTRGAWSLVEYTVPPGSAGPPPHFHEAELQAFYVLSGTAIFTLDNQTFQAPAGSFVLIPPGLIHSFRNEESVPTTVLLLAAPGGIENYFLELAELIDDETFWLPKEPGKWDVLMEKYGRHTHLDRP